VHPPALRAIFNLGVAAAEQGLVPYQAMRGAHAQLQELGVLQCHRVDPPPVPAEPYLSSNGEIHDASDAGVTVTVTPWELFAAPELRVAAQASAAGLQADGAAVVDGVLGPRLAAAVARALASHAAKAGPHKSFPLQYTSTLLHKSFPFQTTSTLVQYEQTVSALVRVCGPGGRRPWRSRPASWTRRAAATCRREATSSRGSEATKASNTPPRLRETRVETYWAGGLLRTSTRPTLNRRAESARLYLHSP